ncbi:aldo/keto reductase [Streptomyces sp. NPDC100445]|uniref:aldo/keto reductase n=1 Tax=Streptomyces sp. NPDC100445 TaxID=3366102 RepID=UPI00380849B9
MDRHRPQLRHRPAADPAGPGPGRPPDRAAIHKGRLLHRGGRHRCGERRFSHRGPGGGRTQPRPALRALAAAPQPRAARARAAGLVLLHNPERAHPGDRLALHRAMREAFLVLEEAMAAGNVAGYGIATWAGLEEEASTAGKLLALAAEAAGGRHHLVAVQMPLSLVTMTPIAQALDGRGVLPAAAGAGLRVMASAPLHGGELPGMVDQELADLIRPGLPPAQACVLAVASCPGVTNVLLAASGAPH